MKREAAWHEKAAHKLGLATLNYTPTRIGQTLHIPCSRGHVVDYPLNTRLPPEQVAKKLMQKGWTVGSKLTCPKHSKKSKAPASAPQQENEDMSVVAPDPIPHRADPFLPSAQAVQTPKQAATMTSDAARVAKRAVMQWLDEAFDVAKGTYNAGVSDETIAKETGLSAGKVKELREEFYGSLREPSELAACREEIAAIKRHAEARIAEIEADAKAAIGALARDCDNAVARIESLAKLNGWRS